MLYYQGYTVSFQEVPDEISLVIEIADCPYKCPGCHSPELQKSAGRDLKIDIVSIIREYSDVITCVCLMGTGRDQKSVIDIANLVHDLGFKAAVYTGSNRWGKLAKHFDYVKYGPYVEKLGGLDSPNTNQHMIKVISRGIFGFTYEDITDKFKRKY